MDILLKKVFVGLPITIGKKEDSNPMEREWISGIFKESVQGAIWLGEIGLQGDGQADLENHGGSEKAVFAYPYEHYGNWQKELGITQISPGGMGENFVMENVLEQAISIGDTFEIGEAVVQVSQPRQPCWKPARRFKVKELALLIQDTGRSGWYFRVLKEGYVEEGQTFKLVDRPSPNWTIERCNQILHFEKDNIEQTRALSQCELLAPKLRTTLQNRVEKGEFPDIHRRVIGPNE